MPGSKTRPVPARLAAAQRRFERWRRTRRLGSRIPQPLWSAAVKLAEVYGVHATAKALGVDYYSLKKRLEHKPPSRAKMVVPANAATFVELAAAARTSVPECIVELEDAKGTKMRIQLKGVEVSDLTALSRSLWGIE